MHFQLIETGTPAYEQLIDLRMNVLLDPIGILRSYIDPVKEAADLLLGAYANDQLIGCCILTRQSETIVQLRQMAVATPVQKSGVGAAILQFAEGLAKQKGYRLLLLHARDNVLPFYEKCGYRMSGDPFFEVGIGHRKMQKDLVPDRTEAR